MNPSSRGVFPPKEALLAPGTLAPGAWRTDSRRTRERYAPAYAGRIESLETQQARFRRGEDFLFVIGWGGSSGPPGELAASAGLFLRNAADLTAVNFVEFERVSGAAIEGGGGVAAIRAPPGNYLVSLELLDPGSNRAWRARHGVEMPTLPRGVVALSDLLLLSPAPETSAARELAPGAPESLAALLPRVLPGSALDKRQIEVAWEVYGLTGREEHLRFRLLAAPEGSTFLGRAARFLRIMGPETRVDLAWEESTESATTSNAMDPVLRRLGPDLSAPPPGPVRLTLSLELPGRNPATAEILLELPR
jgi:hypothetical protein